ncbi:UNVERIFIED_CONTAM: Acid phosphatase 1 [Sesamum calycinum]|uniref:Acid phosphatase 1 n=1 Tax=Sesamum calycinum TaxID=2727403 RepID=A0AAW2NWK0_9LAMI
MFISTMQRLREALVLVFLAICSKAVNSRPFWWPSDTADSSGYCLSWRLAVEANNIRAWRTVPTQCSRHVEAYMTAGQYQRDLNLIVDSICSYVDTITLSDDGFDAWILDVDDTCISNLFYYRGKRYGCEPFDPLGFRAWALQGECGAIPDVLRLFNKLVEAGLRSGAYKGVSAITYKSEIRKQLVEEGYRIWGNVGDQWSDVQGEYAGNRTFKLPNPMYFIP